MDYYEIIMREDLTCDLKRGKHAILRKDLTCDLMRLLWIIMENMRFDYARGFDLIFL